MTKRIPVSTRVVPNPAATPGAPRVTRRTFLGASSTALGGAALAWSSPSALAEGEEAVPAAPTRRPLVVKPILTYATPTPRPQTSWRSWGGIQTTQDMEAEMGRIRRETEALQAMADFPVEFAPPAAIREAGEMDALGDLHQVDTVLLYAAGGPVDVAFKLREQGKNVIIFLRHQSGPVSLWYEIVSPIMLRGHTDQRTQQAVDEEDIVVDSPEEVLWRLRALCGMKNTVGSRILAIGGPAGWATPRAPELAVERFKLDIQDVPYADLGPLIEAAMKDPATLALAKKRAQAYLGLPDTQLETDRPFVENAFVLDLVFRKLMQQAGCGAITINNCMTTIMPLAKTTACLTLSTLNDDGYLAFCESDFVVVPSGLLLANISGKPAFLNDPTFPHQGLITLAHCTGPRKMDGKNTEPARILTHFESDYGAAPKVEMRTGQVITNILPSFEATRWVGVRGEIAAAPFLDICRDQIDVRFTCDSLTLAQRMCGFHWMTGYGDYTRELGYALKNTDIEWELLT